MSNGITNDPVQAMLAQTALQRTLFAPTSRYYGLDTASLTAGDGRPIIYIVRRFVPSADKFQLLQFHTVTQDERLDNVTARYLGDPELFWRLADANSAMRPEELVEKVGRKLRITLPQGITGSSL
jgi:lipopolysaccharide/colanic/teichoic acid biosynthesis glycosyltransferase